MFCANCGSDFVDGEVKVKKFLWQNVAQEDDDVKPQEVCILNALSMVFEISPGKVKNNPFDCPSTRIFEDLKTANSQDLALCSICADSLRTLYNAYLQFLSLCKLESDIWKKLKMLNDRTAAEGLCDDDQLNYIIPEEDFDFEQDEYLSKRSLGGDETYDEEDDNYEPPEIFPETVSGNSNDSKSSTVKEEGEERILKKLPRRRASRRKPQVLHSEISDEDEDDDVDLYEDDDDDWIPEEQFNTNNKSSRNLEKTENGKKSGDSDSVESESKRQKRKRGRPRGKGVKLSSTAQCPVCEKFFCDGSTMRKHLARMHQVRNDVSIDEGLSRLRDTHSADGKFSRTAQCQVCEKHFCDGSTMRKHLVRMHQVRSDVSIDEERKPRLRGKYKKRKVDGEDRPKVKKKKVPRRELCPTCGISIRAFDLPEHLLTHSDERSYLCDFCGKGYKLKSTLKNHVRHVHAKVKNKKCPECDYSCTRPWLLRVHIQTKHNDHQPVFCEHCGKGFRHEKNLRAHYLVHRDAEKLRCKICGKLCSRRDNLRLHIKTIHEGVKPVKKSSGTGEKRNIVPRNRVKYPKQSQSEPPPPAQLQLQPNNAAMPVVQVVTEVSSVGSLQSAPVGNPPQNHLFSYSSQWDFIRNT